MQYTCCLQKKIFGGMKNLVNKNTKQNQLILTKFNTNSNNNDKNDGTYLCTILTTYIHV